MRRQMKLVNKIDTNVYFDIYSLRSIFCCKHFQWTLKNISKSTNNN